MSQKRLVEVFSTACLACEETVALVNRLARASCDVSVLDMHDAAVATRAKGLGIRSVPAVVIDGTLPTAAPGVVPTMRRCVPQGSASHVPEQWGRRSPGR